MLSSGREVNVNAINNKGKTPIERAREIGKKIHFFGSRKNCGDIVDILESFERNPIETRIKLRKELGLAGKTFYFQSYFLSNFK